LQTCPRPTFIRLSACPAGSNESAFETRYSNVQISQVQKNSVPKKEKNGVEDGDREGATTHRAEIRSVTSLSSAGSDPECAATSRSWADVCGGAGVGNASGGSICLTGDNLDSRTRVRYVDGLGNSNVRNTLHCVCKVQTLALAKPENLYEWRLRRLPYALSSELRTLQMYMHVHTGSLENTGPSGTRFTRKALFFCRNQEFFGAGE